MNKELKIFLLTVVSCILTAPGIVHGEEKKDIAGVITAATGEVLTLPYGKTEKEKALSGRFVYEGDSIETKDNSMCAVSLLNDVKLKINRNTSFTFEITSPEEKGKIQKLKLDIGQLWTKLTKRNTKFSIRTPVTVVSVRGTEFDINLLRPDFAEVTVYEGVVEMKNDLGEVAVSAGQKATVTSGEPPSQPVIIDEDKKEKWQEEVKIKGRIDLTTDEETLYAGEPYRIPAKVLNQEGKIFETFSGEIGLRALEENLVLSQDKTKWESAVNIKPDKGSFTFWLKGIAPGSYNLNIESEEIWTELMEIKIHEKEVPKQEAPQAEKKIFMKIRTDENQDETLIIKYK